jgi:DMSO/TMAO reductase YedYZ heme-binding membrane subunit
MTDGIKLLFGTWRKCAESIGITTLLVITGVLVSGVSNKLPSIWAALSSLVLVALMLGLMHYALVGPNKKTKRAE